MAYMYHVIMIDLILVHMYIANNVSTLICRTQTVKNMVDLPELQYYEQDMKYKLNRCTNTHCSPATYYTILILQLSVIPIHLQK